MNQFADHFKNKPLSAPVNIPLKDLRFSVDSLNSALESVSGCDGEGAIKGIVMYHGLDEENRFDVAVQFVCLSPASGPDMYSYNEIDPYYRCIGNALVLQSGTIAEWFNSGGFGERYQEQVAVRREMAMVWDSYTASLKDVSHVVMGNEGTIQNLITDNALDGSSLLEIIPMTEPDSWDKTGSGIDQFGFRHSVVIKAVGVTLDDAVHAGSPFKNKAADLGGLVPPYASNSIKLATTGLPRRPGC